MNFLLNKESWKKIMQVFFINWLFFINIYYFQINNLQNQFSRQVI